MKSINYALIFVFSAVLTVACGGGGGGGGTTSTSGGRGGVGAEFVVITLTCCQTAVISKKQINVDSKSM